MILLTLLGFEVTRSSSWQAVGRAVSAFRQSVRAVYSRVGLHTSRWPCSSFRCQHCKSSHSDS